MQDPSEPGPNRRAVLVGAGVVVAGAAIGFAGYAVYGPEPEASQDLATAAAPGAELAKLADVPANGGIVLSAQQVVLTRGSGDEIHAFTAVCTHLQCLVGSVSDGIIGCPCHGSAFDATTGQVTSGPATRPLRAIAVRVVDGTVREG